MKKKIIFVNKALWIGGIETALVNLLNHIDYDKYEVTCLVLRAELDMAERIPPKCRLVVIDREKQVTFQKKYAFNRLFGFTETCDNPSKLHQMFSWTTPIIKWVENRLYIQYVKELMKDEIFDTAVIYSDVVAETVVRGIKASKYLMFYHHGAMRHVYHDEIGYKKCEKVIAVSENQARELRKFVPKYAGKIMAIHNLTNIEEIREKGNEPTAEAFENDKINIVSCGRVSYEKGMDIAVQVCAELVSRGYDNIRWWIVGGGPAEREVRDAIAEHHMDNHVIMLGMKDNPYPYIKKADLYVQPSRFEGYPMTILEALVLGKVVVSTDNEGASEILVHGVNGILCPIDMKEIANIVNALLKDVELQTTIKWNVSNLDFIKQNEDYISMLEGCL